MDTIPEVVGEDARKVGCLEVKEKAQLDAFEKQRAQAFMEIGNLEHRKFLVMEHIAQIEGAQQNTMTEIKKRLDLAEDNQYVILRNGDILRVDPENPEV